MSTGTRKNIGLFFLCGLLLSVAASAQPRLPDEVLHVLHEECEARPGPMPSDAAFGELLVAVAWRTSHLGVGVSRKTGGHRVPSPVGEIAEDVLCIRPGYPDAGHHWDVIGGAGVGNHLSCGAGPSIGIMRDTNRPCLAAVAPNGGPVVRPPGGTPPPPIVVPPPTSAAVELQIALMAEQVRALRGELEASRRETQQQRDSLYHLIADILIAEHVGSIYERLEAIRGAVGR